jgi:DNA mismatch repair protein MLH1
MIRVKETCAEFFYQLFINKFAHFGQMRFKEPVDLRSASLEALQMEECGWEESHGPQEELASAIAAFLTKKRAMLEEYFSMVIDDQGKLLAFPLVLDNYVPDFGSLPMLIVRLATDVDWEKEQECFDSLCRELASFYSTPELSLETVSEKVWS